MVLEYYKSYISIVNVIPSWDVNNMIFPWSWYHLSEKYKFFSFSKKYQIIQEKYATTTKKVFLVYGSCDIYHGKPKT